MPPQDETSVESDRAATRLAAGEQASDSEATDGDATTEAIVRVLLDWRLGYPGEYGRLDRIAAGLIADEIIAALRSEGLLPPSG